MKNHKGFTLVELLGVLLILALLINPVIPLVNKTIYNSKEAICKNNRETIYRAYDRYQYFYDDYSLAEIINDDNWPNEFEMNRSHRYCPLGGEYVVNSNEDILCSVCDSESYPDEESFYEFITEEDVFLYTSTISTSSGNITGDNATIFLTNGATQDDFSTGGGHASVTNAYFDGDLILDTGSFGLGSSTNPGEFIINGDLYLGIGTRNIYADEIYVSGNLYLKDAYIDATIYVVGDVELDWTPTLAVDTKIFYGGVLTHPDYYTQSILDKVIHVDETSEFDTIPTKEIPPFTMPNVKPDQWYVDNGYTTSEDFGSNIKIFADEYIINYTNSSITDPISDVIVVASDGNIEISNQWNKAVSGFLFAPNGKVILSGISSFEGIVIARDGFEVIGWVPTTFITLEELFPNEENVPFE
jgi:prepilin-type N-terminal cleavage/methylation domain-containing protein